MAEDTPSRHPVSQKSLQTCLQRTITFFLWATLLLLAYTAYRMLRVLLHTINQCPTLPMKNRPTKFLSLHTTDTAREDRKTEPSPPLVEPAAPPEPTPPATPPFNDKGEVEPACWPCQEGQIKGNRDSKKYHVPGGRFYAKTYEGIDCFDTEEEAQQAGYTKSKR